MLGVVLGSGAAFAQDTTDHPVPEGYDSYAGYVIGEFIKENKLGPLGKEAESQDAINPFGGSVGPKLLEIDQLRLTSTGQGLLNFGGQD